MSEPNFVQLQAAWTKALKLRGVTGAEAEAREQLRVMRDQKTTWFGSEENALRIAIDKYLRS